MGIILVPIALILTCLGIFGWLWLCAGFRNGGLRGVLGKVALQLSGFCLVYGFVRGQPLGGLFMAAFPPLALFELVKAAPYQTFLTDVAARALPWAGAALLASLAVPPLRVWSLGLTLIAGLIAAMFVGDQVSQAAMCRTAAKHGFTSFQRNSFVWSLANAPQAFQFELHARADTNDASRAWSYRLMDWYVIPKAAATNAYVTGPVMTCPSP